MKNKILLALAAIMICLGLTACGTIDQTSAKDLYNGLTKEQLSQYYIDKFNETGDDKYLEELEDARFAYSKGLLLPVDESKILNTLSKVESTPTPAPTLVPTSTPAPTLAPEESKLKEFIETMNKMDNVDGNYNVDYAFADSSDPNGKYYYYDPNFESSDWNPYVPAAIPNEANYPTNEQIMKMEKDLSFLYTYDAPYGAFYNVDGEDPVPFYFDDNEIGYESDYTSIVNYETRDLGDGRTSYEIFHVFNDGLSQKQIVHSTAFYVTEDGQVEAIVSYAFNEDGSPFYACNAKFTSIQDNYDRSAEEVYCEQYNVDLAEFYKYSYSDNDNFNRGYHNSMRYIDHSEMIGYGEYLEENDYNWEAQEYFYENGYCYEDGDYAPDYPGDYNYEENYTDSYYDEDGFYHAGEGHTLDNPNYSGVEFLKDFYTLFDQAGSYYFGTSPSH